MSSTKKKKWYFSFVKICNGNQKLRITTDYCQTDRYCSVNILFVWSIINHCCEFLYFFFCIFTHVVYIFFVVFAMLTLLFTVPNPSCPRGLTITWWGCCGLCQRHKPAERAHSFLLCSCVFFCLYGPFNCISFYKFCRRISAFSLCSSGLISAFLTLSPISLSIKSSFSPDVILCGWLGWKHQLTN